MVESGDCARFLFKPPQAFMVSCKVGREKFQRYPAMQLGIFGQVDFAHAAFAQQRNNQVMSHGLTGFEFGAINQHFRRRLISRCINKVIRFFVRLE